MRHQILLVACSAFVSGCTVWSTPIKSNTGTYSDVIEQSADGILLRNVLEARDNAPIHFAELPKITESLQGTASVPTAFPYLISRVGPAAAGLLAGTVTPTLGAQSTPTFEVDALDTKDFATGISSPIDPKYVKYWVDRGLDQRLVLFLFISAIYIKYDDGGPAGPVTTIVHNWPRQAVESILTCQNKPKSDPPLIHACLTRTEFEFFLSLVNSMGPDLTAIRNGAIGTILMEDLPVFTVTAVPYSG